LSTYSAGMMSVPYLFIETQNTARLLVDGCSVQEAKDKVLSDNLYQMNSAYRAERYFNAIVKRLEALPSDLLTTIAKGDLAHAKLLLVVAIARTDLLFFEFLHQVFRPAINMGSKTLDNKEINVFFDQKARESTLVAGWAESTVRHLKSSYVKVLKDAGLLDRTRAPRTIIPGYLPETIVKQLKNAGLSTYLACVLGDAYVY
jgi:hypothetical protein